MVRKALAIWYRGFLAVSVLMVSLCFRLQCAHAEAGDPFDPFNFNSSALDFGDDEGKSPQELLFEASILLDDQRLLDARSKLLKVLKKDPTEYRAHLMLAGYYMVHVGHFKLALKYVKQAEALFYEKEGKPPYASELQRQQHQRILYLLSQARLNLDDYQGALDVLDEFTGFNYFAEWYAGSRAWILMKLGRLDEAVREARTGVLSGAELGRTLNMLGILLSMTGDRSGSIEVFRQAIAYEFSLGRLGQPSTPLNNVGEVYEEIFNEAMAQSSYSRAVSLPDGCEHVLPSLNLAMLYLDELNLAAAKRTIDSFESCVAQFPLRNGEEHRALVHLVRGRIALLAGHTDTALEHFREVLRERQWFGKIGTTQEDLLAAGSVSLAHALLRKNDVLSVTPPESIWERASRLKEQLNNRLEAWWLHRRAKQVLMEDLNEMEDIFIRNTDSMIDYPTFGEALSRVPRAALETRISNEEKRDRRPASSAYYALYRAEHAAKAGRSREALTLLDSVIADGRPQFDNAVKLRALLVKLGLFTESSPGYRSLAVEIFRLSRPSLRNFGFKLPVDTTTMPAEVRSALAGSAFLSDDSKESHYELQFSAVQNGTQEAGYRLSLVPRTAAARATFTGSSAHRLDGEGQTIEGAVRALMDSVFQLTIE